ncbi:GNAT family N-acetyltransferase [Micromonospora nigra]|uniref:GNAT family N-acetyltransferase n=1 Tax=Micromonospora nigra TaxID=145857 RepID=UPI0015868A80|nr:GNAT family N-acetyltransferase [Micromonospora nigra]
MSDSAAEPGRLVVRPATRRDLHATARAHVDLLPVGLFPSLGPRFVRRWHRTFLDSRHGVGYVAVDPSAPGEEFVGFLLGTTDQTAHIAALLTDRRAVASLAVAAASALVRRPKVATRLLRSRVGPWTRRFRSRKPRGDGPDRPTAAPQVAVMTALAVRPEWRGTGIGSTLVTHFVEHARLAGATTAELVTPTGPTGAPTFYERLGWEAGPQESTPDGEGLSVYRRSLRDADPS